MSEALDYLKKREWIMGNGQCPDCCGVPASWHGHPLYMGTENIGHKAGCPLAAALAALGAKPLMQGAFKSDVEFEHFISESGLFGTRPKTATGCPRYRAYQRTLRRDLAGVYARVLNEEKSLIL